MGENRHLTNAKSAKNDEFYTQYAKSTYTNGTDTITATFAYDSQGRRVRKVTPTATHLYFYDGWLLVRETATDLSTLQPFNSSTDYVWGKDISGTEQGAGGVGGLLYLTVSNSNSNSKLQLELPTPTLRDRG